MPTFNSQTLLQQLQGDVSSLLNVLHTRIMPQPHAALLSQPAPGGWSVIQCLDHLNSYGLYYLPQLEAALGKGEQLGLPAKPAFKSGWFGNYFTNMMQPRPDGALKSKMNAPKGHRPVPQPAAAQVLDEFAAQQQRLLQLLQRAGQTDIGRLRVPTSLTRLIKLSAGDTFRFLIAHEQRHMLQALRALLAATGNNHTAVSMQHLADV
ncbi:DinB family protein [Chitinophaga alhagiae]|uniref:DinB family protein n=1 Tax=Chitinophaga alhagiae TaxID=2203219 RepID=A0ABM6WCR4_9BACT|nr:DinB family protein [Chitinophaga alhagiae]AWO01724.1 DinB family protein [Chitinophaga alhagiae]